AKRCQVSRAIPCRVARCAAVRPWYDATDADEAASTGAALGLAPAGPVMPSTVSAIAPATAHTRRAIVDLRVLIYTLLLGTGAYRLAPVGRRRRLRFVPRGAPPAPGPRVGGAPPPGAPPTSRGHR